MKYRAKIALFAICLVLVLLVTYVTELYLQTATIHTLNIVERIIRRLTLFSGEYLFFIGTTYISLLLLKRKKWLKAIIIFFVGVLWVGIYKSIFGFIGQLGRDSFAEARSFDIDEAKFWLRTLPSIVQFKLSAQLFGFYALLAFISCVVLSYIITKMKITTRHYSYVTFSIASILIVGAIYQSVSKTVFLFITNSENYELTSKKFTNKVPSISVDQTDVDLLVYIGESTTVMNMGVYGYLRDTTPHLTELKDTDPNFLMFQNVFSTHTHTSPSLLEAFSFGLLKEDQYLPINIRRRISIVDILKEGKITVDLYSNQGQTGSWNQAASIIFKNANRTFSIEATKLGNYDFKLKRPSDHEFFRAHITNKTIETQASRKSLNIFHSYAGHLPYLSDSIPDAYHQRVDQKLSKKNAKAIVGKVVNNLEKIEAYDSSGYKIVGREVSVSAFIPANRTKLVESVWWMTIPDLLEIDHYSEPEITMKEPHLFRGTLYKMGTNTTWDELNAVASTSNEIFEIANGWITNKTQSEITIVRLRHSNTSTGSGVFQYYELTEQTDGVGAYYPSYPNVKIPPDSWDYLHETIPALSKVDGYVFLDCGGFTCDSEYRWLYTD